MPKRIALFLVGVALAIGAFLLYQFLSGPAVVPPPKAKITLTTDITPLPMTIEERDADGRLIYKITAPKAPVPVTSATGSPIPGQFRIESPVARFYDKTGRPMQVEADVCEIAIAHAMAAGASGGLTSLTSTTGKSTIRLDQIAGTLSGHARMAIGAKPGVTTQSATQSSSKDPFANGVRIYFDGPVKLDGASQELTADGGLHIRSDTIEADQQGMKLIFDQKTREIQSLSIEENPTGNRLIVRNMGEKAMSMLGGSKEPTTGAGAAINIVAPTATSPTTKPKEPPPTYRLSFGQNVTAKAGDRGLTAEHLYLIFQASQDLLGGDNATKPAANSAPAPLPINPTAGLESIPLEVTPIAAAKPQDLVITWSGPLEMLPAEPDDAKLAAGGQVVLDAVGTAQKPVTIKNDRFEALVGRLKYRTAQPILLLPEDYKKVVLRGLAGTVTPGAAASDSRSDIECGAVTLTSIDKDHFHALLMGPGNLVSHNKNDRATVQNIVRWKTQMDLDLVSAGKGNDFLLRGARFDGAQITSTQTTAKGAMIVSAINADLLDLLIANVTGSDGKTNPMLEHMLATGNVLVSKKGSEKSPLEEGGIKGERVEYITKKTGTQPPEPTELRADGNVTAWRVTDKPITLAAAASMPTTGPINPADTLQRETVMTPKLIATLLPKPKGAPATSPAATAPALALDMNIEVSHFVATGGVRIESLPPASQKKPALIATADSVDAWPLADKQTATLLAAADPSALVHVSIGENTIDARRIDVDQVLQNYKVPGAGVFHFVLPPDGKQRLTATPMVITWQQLMNFDGNNLMAVFNGKPVVRLPGEHEDLGTFACDTSITVKLKQAAGATTAPTTGPSKAQFDKLDLDWMQASGNVQAYGAQFDADNKLLRRIRLSVPETLKYTKAGDLIDIPGEGFMVVEDNRPETAANSTRIAGETDFLWKGGLKRDAAGNITISKGVNFYFKPSQPFKFTNGLTPRPTATAPAGTIPTHDMVHLATDQLVATMAPPPATKAAKSGSPIGLEANNVSKVTTSGGALLEIMNYQVIGGAMKNTTKLYTVAGDNMAFAPLTNIAIINGTADEPAVAQRIGTNYRFTGSAITLDMTKDKGAFSATGLQGTFEGFGQ